MKKKVLRSILAAIAATSLALGFLPGNLAVNLGIVTESEAAGGYQIMADPQDASKVLTLLPSGYGFNDVKPYAEQAAKDSKLAVSKGGKDHVYFYSFSGFKDIDPGDSKLGSVGAKAFLLGEDGAVFPDDNANYWYDGNEHSDVVFHIFLFDAPKGVTVVSLVSEVEEEQQLLPPHIHDYHWEAVTDPTINQDGEMQYRCSCGDVKEKQPIPAAQIYVKGLYGAVKEAAPNGTVEYDAGKMHTISDYILNKMSERSDVTVNVKFEYKGVKYQITFPAGTDYTKVLTDEPTMYGYFGVAAELGLAVTEL